MPVVRGAEVTQTEAPLMPVVRGVEVTQTEAPLMPVVRETEVTRTEAPLTFILVIRGQRSPKSRHHLCRSLQGGQRSLELRHHSIMLVSKAGEGHRK